MLGATAFSRPKGPVIWRIQVEKPKAFDLALHFKCVALDHIGNSLPCLLSAVRVQLDTVAERLSTFGDGNKRHAIADTGVNDRGLIWKPKIAANPLGFG